MTADGFPALRAKVLLKILLSIGYEEKRVRGSHRILRCPGRQGITFSFHDGADISPGLVRSILVREVGLTVDEALEVIRDA